MILVTFYVLLCVKNIRSVYQEDPCRAHGGQCIDNRIESCRGGQVQKLIGTNKSYGCPTQPNNVLCCLKQPYQEPECSSNGGICIDTNNQSCLSGKFRRNDCPTQPSNVKCCIASKVDSDGNNKRRRRSLFDSDESSFASPEIPNFPSPEIPNFESPEIPNFPSPEIPNFESPEIPNFPSPEIPNFESPEIPNFASPEILPSREVDLPNQENPCHDLGGRCIDLTVHICYGKVQRYKDYTFRDLCPNQSFKILCCFQSRTIDSGESSPETRPTIRPPEKRPTLRPPERRPTIRPPERSRTCGRVSHTTYIRGGRDSPNAGRWPWIVSLQTSDKKHICGGVLIAPNYVLTAAHCGSLPRIVLGDYDLKKFSNPNRIVRNLSRRIPHQDYHSKEKIVGDNKFIEELRNDIAIYKLSNSVGYTDFIKPVCLPDADDTSSLPVGTECHIIGWGYLHGEARTTPTILQEASVRISDPSLCRDNIFNSATMICVANSGPSTCGGDSGGPLLCRKNAGLPWVVYGVTSYGTIGCNGQSVFTKVQVFRSWIQRAII